MNPQAKPPARRSKIRDGGFPIFNFLYLLYIRFFIPRATLML